MSTGVLLSAKELSVRFGGVLAVNKVSFDVHRGEVFTLIGPNGAGKTTVFNLISRIYTPTSGAIEYDGTPLLARAPHEIAPLGIARTFQNIELFEHATVLQNLLIGRHVHRETGFWSQLLFTRATREAEEIQLKLALIHNQLHRQIQAVDLFHRGLHVHHKLCVSKVFDLLAQHLLDSIHLTHSILQGSHRRHASNYTRHN